mgnify:FL=1
MIALVDYKAGNTFSVLQAFKRLGEDWVLTDDPQLIKQADKVVFPGVGAASSAMHNLEQRNLIAVLKSLEQPFLGICLGMQLLAQWSEEGDTPMLAIVPVQINRFRKAPKSPHMGWNSLQNMRGPLFRGIEENADFYFVHSYRLGPSEFSIADCNYGDDFTAAVNFKNFYGLQFHPEKSGANGAKLLQNFIDL